MDEAIHQQEEEEHTVARLGSAMVAVDLQHLYDCDPRPTFIVDCHALPPTICHINPALESNTHRQLLAHSIQHHNTFRDWWHPASNASTHNRDEFWHERSRWFKFTACNRWLVVSLVQEEQRVEESGGLLSEAGQGQMTLSVPPPRVETIFTVKVQSEDLRKHIDHLRTVNWVVTSLGPIESWSYELNSLVMTLMLETRPTALFLGPEHTIVYNVAYGALSGSRHPGVLGKSVFDAWPELADTVSATVERSRQTRFVDAPEDDCRFMIERNGFLEECFVLWSLIPLRGPIDGLYSIITEVTKHRLLERRIRTLFRVGKLSSRARDMKAFWSSIYDAMIPCEYEFPTAILYSVGPGNYTSRSCKLEWSIGYGENHSAIPESFDLGQGHGLARAVLECSQQGSPILFYEDSYLPASLFREIQTRGFGDPCRAFIVIPVTIYDETITGYLIASLSTRSPYDSEYEEWIEVFSNLLGASAASVALCEEEVRKRKTQEEEAAKERETLSAEVAVLTQEASEVAEKLQNFHDIANGVGLGYFEFDSNGRLKYANEAYFNQTGHRRDLWKAPPFSFLECVYEPDVAVARDQWDMSVSGGTATFEIRWKRSSNTKIGNEEQDTRDYLWTLTNCIPITSEEGKVTGVFGCNTDISAQKEAERAAVLRMEAERRLASFTELAPVGFYHLNANLEMEYCNSQWFAITNHPKVSYDQIDWRLVVCEEDLEGIYRDVQTLSRKEGSHSFSFRLRKKWVSPDGVETPTWLLATACTHFDQAGNTASIMGTMNDISQLKWAESVQQSRVEEALESKRQQENFIDMTSHELRNPLSAMVQCADAIASSLGEMAVLTSEKMDGQAQARADLKDLIAASVDAIETIQACATHQKRIVDDILTLSKLDSKLLVISPIVTQPIVLLRDVYKMFKEEAAKALITLKAHCDPSIKKLNIEHSILDPSRVIQVLVNLLTNAIKFTQKQPIRKVEILMSASKMVERKPGVDWLPQQTSRIQKYNDKSDDENTFYLYFTVKDTGCGLSDEQKAKLFRRFSQASPKTHVQYGGSGLGLFISRELAEMQGGRIGVQSTQAVGSAFSFYIQAQRATPPGASPLNLLPDVNSTTIITPEIPKYHILVVEDNLINQRVLCAQLRKHNCTLQIANHGLEALSELQKTHFATTPTIPSPFQLSVVLMDVEMPIMDGLACARKIREMERTGVLKGHVPIIAVSANARPEQVKEAILAGMDQVVAKPFRIDELLGAVKGVVERLGVS